LPSYNLNGKIIKIDNDSVTNAIFSYIEFNLNFLFGNLALWHKELTLMASLHLRLLLILYCWNYFNPIF